MSQYLNTQSILNAALGEYHAKGFRLIEPDDHTLILLYHDKRIAVFSEQSALIPSIHRACLEHLQELERV